jgi:hypothetical protein
MLLPPDSAPLSADGLSFWFLADRGAHFRDQLWREFLHAVCNPTVFRALVQNFSPCLKVAVHAYFPASNDLCRVGTLQVICFVESVFLLPVVDDFVVHLLALGVRAFLGGRAGLAIL